MQDTQDKSAQAKQQARKGKGKGGGQFVSQGGPRAKAAPTPDVDLKAPTVQRITGPGDRWAKDCWPQISAVKVNQFGTWVSSKAREIQQSGMLKPEGLAAWENAHLAASAFSRLSQKLQNDIVSRFPAGKYEFSNGVTAEIIEEECTRIDHDQVWDRIVVGCDDVSSVRDRIDAVHAAPKWRVGVLSEMIDFDENCATTVPGSGPQVLPVGWTGGGIDGPLSDGWDALEKQRGIELMSSMMFDRANQPILKAFRDLKDERKHRSDDDEELPDYWKEHGSYYQAAYGPKDEAALAASVELLKQDNEKLLDAFVESIPVSLRPAIALSYAGVANELRDRAQPFTDMLTTICANAVEQHKSDLASRYGEGHGVPFRDALITNADPDVENAPWKPVVSEMSFRGDKAVCTGRKILRGTEGGPPVAVLTSGNRHKGFDHEEIKNRLEAAAGGDPARYVEMFRRACPDDWKKRDLSKNDDYSDCISQTVKKSIRF